MIFINQEWASPGIHRRISHQCRQLGDSISTGIGKPYRIMGKNLGDQRHNAHWVSPQGAAGSAYNQSLSGGFRVSHLYRKIFSQFSIQKLRRLLLPDLTIVVFAEKFSIPAKCLPKDSTILRRAQPLNTQFVFPAGDFESVSIYFSNLKLSKLKTITKGIASFEKERRAFVHSAVNRFKHAL